MKTDKLGMIAFGKVKALEKRVKVLEEDRVKEIEDKLARETSPE